VLTLSVLSREMTHLEEIQVKFHRFGPPNKSSCYSALDNLKYLGDFRNPMNEPGVQAISKMKHLIKSLLWTPSLSAAQKKTLTIKLPNTTLDFCFDGR